MKTPTVVRFESKEDERAYALADRLTSILELEEYSELSENSILSALINVIARVVENLDARA